MSKTPFYITTAIAYASRKPHIGNCYDIVLADMIARYKRLCGYDVRFCTGADEHGQKIEQQARELGVSPQEYVDKVSSEIRAQWDCLETTYDTFIRTTDARHEKVVQKVFDTLYANGDIYKSEYQGKYCVPCESFFTTSQLVNGKCPDCGREVIDAKEEAYFLRTGKYQDRLMRYYEENPSFFRPASRKAEMVNNFLKPGLADLCITRSTFTWGIPVSFDPKHIIYVWIDALLNYITALGYDPDGSGELFRTYWPADLHVIGKDIMRFHTVYWPIILMALGLPLPKQVLGHPWLLSGEDKMSKSRGNVLYADDLVSRFGADAVRYYLLSTMPYADDGTITYESLIAKYNADLANTLGNLVSRTVAMALKYFDGCIEMSQSDEPMDRELKEAQEQTVEQYRALMDDYRNADTADAVMNFAKRCNKYIDETAPWLLARDDSKKGRLQAVLYRLLDGIRTLSVLLRPFIPGACAAIAVRLGLPEDEVTLDTLRQPVPRYTVSGGDALFQRLDPEKTLAQIEAELATGEPAPENDKTLTFLDDISIDEFAKTDLRAAKILACEPVKRARKLLKLTLDDGSGTERTVVSGIAPYYRPEELVGRTAVLVANLKPATLCGVESRGMLLAADVKKEDGSDEVRVIFADGAAPGSKIR